MFKIWQKTAEKVRTRKKAAKYRKFRKIVSFFCSSIVVLKIFSSLLSFWCPTVLLIRRNPEPSVLLHSCSAFGLTALGITKNYHLKFLFHVFSNQRLFFFWETRNYNSCWNEETRSYNSYIIASSSKSNYTILSKEFPHIVFFLASMCTGWKQESIFNSL